MIIKIDNREKQLIALVNHCLENTKSPPERPLVQVSALPLGDVIICRDAGEEVLMIERKSLRDLASSIIDGRYKEQCFRLEECSIPNHSIVYLIEGNMHAYNPGKARIGEGALWSAMITLAHKKGFSVFRTMSIAETADYICRLASRLSDTRSTSESPASDYASVVKRVKKDNINPGNAAVIMLSQLPGVSVKVATAIMQEYKTLPALIAELQTNPGMLCGLTIECESGKTRSIPKNVSKTICHYLQIDVS